MTLNAQRISTRREIERELFTLGLTRQDIATTMQIDSGSIANDLKYLGGFQAFPDTSHLTNNKRRNRAYQKALETYATLSFATLQYPNWIEHNFEWWPIKSFEPDVVHGVVDALKQYLDIKHIRGIADGVACMVYELANPIDAPEYTAHRNLLRAIFGETKMNISGEVLLDRFLNHCRENSVFPTRFQAQSSRSASKTYIDSMECVMP